MGGGGGGLMLLARMKMFALDEEDFFPFKMNFSWVWEFFHQFNQEKKNRGFEI